MLPAPAVRLARPHLSARLSTADAVRGQGIVTRRTQGTTRNQHEPGPRLSRSQRDCPVRPAVAEAVARALMLPGTLVDPSGGAVPPRGPGIRPRAGRRPGWCPPGTGGVHQRGTEARECGPVRALGRRGQPKPTRLLHSATEHPCVAAGHRFPEGAVEQLPVTPDGVIDLAVLERRLAALANESVLISVHAANNETGAVQPLADIVALARARMAQRWCTAMPCRLWARSPSTWAPSGSMRSPCRAINSRGPKGVGAMILADDVALDDAFLRGGGQERRSAAGPSACRPSSGMGEAARSPARRSTGRPHASRACATGSRPASLPRRPTRWCSPPAPCASPTRSASRSRVSMPPRR